MLGLGPERAAPPAAAPLPLAPSFATALPEARLAGQGDFRWFGMRIYEARFWVGPQGYSAGAPMAAPFVLELRYALGLQGKRIALKPLPRICAQRSCARRHLSHERPARRSGAGWTGAGRHASRAPDAAWVLLARASYSVPFTLNRREP